MNENFILHSVAFFALFKLVSYIKTKMITLSGLILTIILLILFDRFVFRNQKLVETANQFRGPFMIPIFGNSLVNFFKKPEGIQFSIFFHELKFMKPILPCLA